MDPLIYSNIIKWRYCLNSRNEETDHYQEVRTRTHLNSSKACTWNLFFYCNFCFSYKPFNKQKPEEELKDKNELLEAVNKQLHQKLTETQVRRPPSSDSLAASGESKVTTADRREASSCCGSPRVQAGKTYHL
jgi:hypothetical protein